MKYIAIVAALAAAPAQAYITKESYVVSGDAQRFTVRYEPGSAARQYWCAAGQFVDNHLAMLPTTPIYRLSPRPLARGEGMTVSISPEGAIGDTGVAVFPPPDHLSAGFAASLCDARYPLAR
ncbi:hypothetical protein [Falsirhodobacter deserti]|uniref:hypothetical protein n=1 Tax=Falsirhodobacter deserti TaxID=1365611 RepID=UPI000FE2B004|nr:hypothetical protein [Falsirhodobacter deserti]